MYEEVTARSAGMDMIFKLPLLLITGQFHIADEKIKKSDSSTSIELERTDDILKYLGEHKVPGQFLCGFSYGNRKYAGEFQKEAGKKEP